MSANTGSFKFISTLFFGLQTPLQYLFFKTLMLISKNNQKLTKVITKFYANSLKILKKSMLKSKKRSMLDIKANFSPAEL